jgi:hypothetical protein
MSVKAMLLASAVVASVGALVAVSVALAADPLDPKVRINSTDQARATALVLVRDDLGPAWAGGVRKPTALKLPICPAYHPDDSDLTITGHAESLFTLASGGIQVDTDVEILKTAKQVDVQFTRIFQPKLATCLKYDLLKSVGGTNVIIGKVTRLDLPKLGSHSGVFRVALIYKTGKTGVDVVTDFMFLGQGRAEFFVNIVAPASVKSQLPGLEARIARTLIKRAGG